MSSIPAGQIETGSLTVGGESIRVQSYGLSSGVIEPVDREIKVFCDDESHDVGSLGLLARNSESLVLHKTLKRLIKAGHEPQAESKMRVKHNRKISFTKIGPIVVGSEVPKIRSDYMPPNNTRIVSVGPFGLKSALGIKK